MDIFKLDHYVSSEGLNCILCGKPLDTKTTITMLCKSCKNKEWGKNQLAKFKEKTGLDNPMNDPEIIRKIQNTMQKRYGANCAMNVPEFRKKFEETCKERYGTSYYVNSSDFINKSSCKSKINLKFNELLLQNGIKADMEKEYDDKRFDFRIQDRKLFIELDPTYTHNVAGNHWEKEGLPKEQQLVKTLIAEKYGYRCVHVFDWDNWDDIIDLIKPTDKIFARKCILKQITDKSYNEFIDMNHIQKNCKGTKIALGLYYKDELVQVMTFGKPRYNKNYQWELLRLCTKKGYSVTGGASKLFKYAIDNLHLTSIISYCDRSKFKGDVYLKLGMNLLRQTQPQEVWSKGSERITGSLLRQRGYDQLFDSNYGKGTSNEMLMLEHGWLPVYDCGQLVFTYGQPVNKDQSRTDFNSDLNYADMLKGIDKKKEKICEFCGEPFVPRSNFQRYCKRPHYMNCPVCGKKYLVTNNENLKRPPVACSYECRVKRTQETSMKKYGVKAPGNNPEARKKAKETMQERFGVDYAMQSEVVHKKSEETLLERYGVDNIQKLNEVSAASHNTAIKNWIKKVHQYLPMKKIIEQHNPKFIIDDDKMEIYLLTEKASTTFLSRYGFWPDCKFGKIHMSIGLVNDGILYQVLRFERKKGKIILANFGIRAGYFNPNYYNKLMRFATCVKGIDSFSAAIPRELANEELLKSLSVKKVSDGEYKVFWMIDEKLIELTQRDDIQDMLSKYDYITTDYLDEYEFVNTFEQEKDSNQLEFIIRQENMKLD